MTINIEDFKEIDLEGEIIECHKEGTTLFMKTQLSPKIIDSNFDELENMITDLNNTIRNQNLKIEKLEHKINILEAINKNA